VCNTPFTYKAVDGPPLPPELLPPEPPPPKFTAEITLFTEL